MWKPAIISTAIPLVMLMLPTPASAGGVTIAVDGGMAIGTQGLIGPGFKARAGYQIDAAILHINPEVGTGINTGDITLITPFVGLRVGIGAGLVPSVYAQAGRTLGQYGGSTATFGAALDLTAIPKINLGIHGEYDTYGRYVTPGIHVGVKF